MIVTKVTLSMRAPVNTAAFKHLQVLQRIEHLSALPSPQGKLKCYYLILLHAHSLQWCLNDHQTVAWVNTMLRPLSAQLVDIVSLPPPACICVPSLVLTAQHRDHLPGLSAHVLVQKHPCFVIKALMHSKKNPIFINTMSIPYYWHLVNVSLTDWLDYYYTFTEKVVQRVSEQAKVGRF